MRRERDALRRRVPEADAAAGRLGSSAQSPAELLLQLQSSAGNQAVSRMIAQQGIAGRISRRETGGGGAEVVVPPDLEQTIRTKGKDHVEPDFSAPEHSPKDVSDVKAYLYDTVVKSGEATKDEVDETIDGVDGDIKDARREKAQELAKGPGRDAEDEDEAEEEEEEQGEDPVAVVERLDPAQGETTEKEPAQPPEQSQQGDEPAPSPEALGKASEEEVDFLTDVVEDKVHDVGIPVHDGGKSPEDLDAIWKEIDELLARLQAQVATTPAPNGGPPGGPGGGPPPGGGGPPAPGGGGPGKGGGPGGGGTPPPAPNPPAPGGQAVAPPPRDPFFDPASPDGPLGPVEAVDKGLGPSAEASLSFPTAQVTALTGGMTGKVSEYGQGKSDPGWTGSDAFFTGFTNTLDAAGGVARMITGVKRAHAGRKAGDRSELVGGILDVLNGVGTAAKAGIGTASKALGDAAPKLLNAFGAVLGVVLSTVSTIRYSIATHKAIKRKGRVRELQHDYERKARTASSPEEFDFYRRLRAAAFVMKHKSGRRFWKKLLGTGGAGIGVLAGIAAVVFVITAANIWNPIGWALTAASGAIALGLTAWAIYRRIRRHRNRKDLTERATKMEGPEGPVEGVRREVAGSQYAEWLINEGISSSKKLHKDEIKVFLEQVVGTKRTAKLLTPGREKKSIAELGKKFGS